MTKGGLMAEEKQGILIITLNDPARLNPLSSTLLNEIARVLQEYRADPKVLLLASKGRVFSAGIDLSEVASATSPSQAAKPFKALGNVLRELIDYPAPTLSYINGPAIAGGAELALATDIIMMSPSARLEWPEVRWNLVAPLYTALAGRIGVSRLASGAILAERFSTDEALAFGIASYKINEGIDEAMLVTLKVRELWEQNRESFSTMLPILREWKKKAIEELVPRLSELGANMELVERARRFIKKGD